MHRVLTAATAVLAGCLFAASALAERPQFDNSVKYRDSGIPNARGRSGNATIEARALLDKNGVTTLEVTTNGIFEKVQVKIPTDGDAITYNYANVNSATFSTTLSGLARGDALQVHATVGGVDANRTDIVSATETVKLRPDLSVVSVSVPPHAAVDLPVRVTALVTEKNGDVGARADCVLYDGDALVLRSEGIWVDAGGAVTCSFVATFDQPGVKNLRVAAENVDPADWDLANNSATAQTQLYAASEPFPEWNTWCQEFETHDIYRYTSSSYSNFEESWETRQVSTLSATFTGPMNLPTVQVTGAVSTDGELLYLGDEITEEYKRLPAEIFGDTSYVKLYGDGFDGLIWAEGSGANQRTTVDLRRLGGDVTYHREGFEYDYWRGYYTWNEDGSFSHGTVSRPYGNTVSMTMTISDGTTMWEQNQSNMPLNPYESVESWSFCNTRRSGSTYCESLSVDMHGRWGFDFPPH